MSHIGLALFHMYLYQRCSLWISLINVFLFPQGFTLNYCRRENMASFFTTLTLKKLFKFIVMFFFINTEVFRFDLKKKECKKGRKEKEKEKIDLFP